MAPTTATASNNKPATGSTKQQQRARGNNNQQQQHSNSKPPTAATTPYPLICAYMIIDFSKGMLNPNPQNHDPTYDPKYDPNTEKTLPTTSTIQNKRQTISSKSIGIIPYTQKLWKTSKTVYTNAFFFYSPTRN
eukprot:1330252-Amphidinium_carterae.1